MDSSNNSSYRILRAILLAALAATCVCSILLWIFTDYLRPFLSGTNF